jgi:quinol monooxygenase YgiN
MGHTLGQARVEDFDRFWEVFRTRGAELRKRYGSNGARVFQHADDPNSVTIVFDWEQDQVEAFLADPESKEVMGAAGLQGPPAFTFLESSRETDS